ncbi:hypothetical protein PR048_003064 [Dryococelus australis]|uniref:Uncharacterized protein n=1 Tax=Dryococelus australis TaxID=614101 RepID=A0ABQ9IND7_9NEOP|nr:hypothetical protein PR048_003064 [Dryococelus australis]
MRVIELSMERRLNEGAGETGDPRENPPANGIVRHDSHFRPLRATLEIAATRTAFRVRLQRRAAVETSRDDVAFDSVASEGTASSKHLVPRREHGYLAEHSACHG